MRYIIVLAFHLAFTSASQAQTHGFPFGKVTHRELDMTLYEKDTSAYGLVLNEFGDTYVDNEVSFKIVMEYHVKIKILKKEGLSLADFEIPLIRLENGQEAAVRSIRASAFNKENGMIVETELAMKNVFTDKNKNYSVKKFAVPNVRVGSVIEVFYKVEWPYIFNWRPWQFQSDIPKVHSEYWTLIPGTLVYNISLRGFLKLYKEESEVVRECISANGGRADCVRSKYVMKDIPAFVDEDYMTARSNFLSAINFELSEIRYFDGRVDKVTKEWKDAEQELERNEFFGLQLRRGKDIVDEHINTVVAGETDPLTKAKKIYEFIKNWYEWNGEKSKYSDEGIKKAFDRKKGNAGDINLSLIAALRYAGLNVEPVILSTRENGFPVEIYPVISDFNYVIAKVNIGEKSYLVDATDDFYPFGLLPFRCLNGKGRVLGETKSYWIDLKPSERAKHIAIMNLKMDADGMIRGTIQVNFTGYEAVTERKSLKEYGSLAEYVANFDKENDLLEVTDFSIKNAEDPEKPLIEQLEVEIANSDAANFLFNPIIFGRWRENPFKSKERIYPVDFGMTIEQVTMVNLEYPESYEVLNSPEKIGLALPNGGGRYVFELQHAPNKLSLSKALIINKALFPSQEYPHLKELFSRMIQVQNGDLIFRKKI